MATPTAPQPIAVDIVAPATGKSLRLLARTIVLAAGAGNETLLAAAGLVVPAMQRRPLRMMLLRGRLEPIYGHFVHGGRTRLTVTSAPGRSGDEIVWAIGGQIAEELAICEDEGVIHERAVAELLHAFPHLPLEELDLASYRATRAEASDPSHRRPSGFFLQAAASGVLVAWPTKLALAPLVADAVVTELTSSPPASASSDPSVAIDDWPRPSVAPYPWEEVEWRCAR